MKQYFDDEDFGGMRKLISGKCWTKVKSKCGGPVRVFISRDVTIFIFF